MWGVFIYCYASWPQEVRFSENADWIVLDKGYLFYSCLVLTAVLNALVFAIVKLRFSTDFITWFYGLLIAFHTFLVSGFILITIFNSLETYDYAMMGPTVYGSIFLLMAWILAWPVYFVYQKLRPQSAISE